MFSSWLQLSTFVVTICWKSAVFGEGNPNDIDWKTCTTFVRHVFQITFRVFNTLGVAFDAIVVVLMVADEELELGLRTSWVKQLTRNIIVKLLIMMMNVNFCRSMFE